MPVYQLSPDRIEKLEETSFAQESVLEREHLQRVLRSAMNVLVPNAMVLAEEFGDWHESYRRIDLLALDKTTTVMWLNEHQLDIRCVRMQPYRFDGRVFLDVQQIVPLPEATNYQVQLKEKATERRSARQQGEGPDFTRYDLVIGEEQYKAQWKRHLIYHVVKAAIRSGVAPEAIPVPSSKWFIVDGDCADRESFEQHAEQHGTDRVYDRRRWFNESDELFRMGTRTLAFSNQWSGPNALRAIDAIAAQHPELRIAYQEAKDLAE